MNDERLAGLRVTPDELRSLVDVQAGYVEAVLREGEASLTPSLLLQTKVDPTAASEQAVYMLAIDFNDDHVKRQALRKIGAAQYGAKRFITAAVLASECWRAPDRGPDGRTVPADNSRREEGVIVFGMSLEMAPRQEAVSAFYPVARVRGGMRQLTRQPERADRVTSPLLYQVYAGFFLEVARKQGVPQ